ncbi:MAG: hypothetical protein QXZ67_02760 [Thermoplasmata archaeon]
MAYLSTIFAILLPTLVVGMVVLSYTYPTSTSGKAPEVYLAQGPNYNAANSLGLFYAKMSGNPANISSGTTIYFNYTYGAYNEALLNVLEIVNGVTGRTVTITFDNVTLPSGVTMYISTSATELGYSVSSKGVISITGGESVSTGTSITLSGTTYYIGFLFNNTVISGTGTIVFHYIIS